MMRVELVVNSDLSVWMLMPPRSAELLWRGMSSKNQVTLGGGGPIWEIIQVKFAVWSSRSCKRDGPINFASFPK
jgi:hypothetical protein